MAIGQLNQQVTVKKKIKHTNIYGEQTFTWSDYTTPWANIKYGKGNEGFDADQLTATNEVEFKIRKHPTKVYNEELSVLYQGLRYDITHIKQEGLRPAYLTLSAFRNTSAFNDTWLLTGAVFQDQYQWVDTATWQDS